MAWFRHALVDMLVLEMVEQLTKLFERLVAELPPGTASLSFRKVQDGQGTAVGLIPANPFSADFGVHTEDGSDLVDFSFGRATWEFPYERRYRKGEKDIITEIEEISRAIIAGHCEVSRRLFWATSRIHVGDYTYCVTDMPMFPIPPFRTHRYAPYLGANR